MVQAFAAFLEFCYLVRRSVIDEDTLIDIERALERFHKARVIFETAGVRSEGFSLPRQHALKHYVQVIQAFGAPNGLCSSITESKHIKAVKQPWRRSNRYKALGQMLTTNSRMDKLAAIRVHFDTHSMLDVPTNSVVGALAGQPCPGDLNSRSRTSLGSQTQAAALAERDIDDGGDEDPDDGEAVEGSIEAEVLLSKSPGACLPVTSLCVCTPVSTLVTPTVRKIPRDLDGLARYLQVPHLRLLLQRFLYEQLHPDVDPTSISATEYPIINSRILVYSSAIATFFAPSDSSGMQGMRRERIRAVNTWHGGPPRRDCAFLTKDPSLPGFRGLYVVRVHAFLSFRWHHKSYPCALVSWFLPIGDTPCPDTGLWMVRPERDRQSGCPVMSVVHLDTMVRAAHLIGIAGQKPLPSNFSHSDSLDAFQGFFVNKFADHHSHTIAF